MLPLACSSCCFLHNPSHVNLLFIPHFLCFFLCVSSYVSQYYHCIGPDISQHYYCIDFEKWIGECKFQELIDLLIDIRNNLCTSLCEIKSQHFLRIPLSFNHR